MMKLVGRKLILKVGMSSERLECMGTRFVS